jgi:hypothetical protein
MSTTATLTVDRSPRLIASRVLPLAVVTNVGTEPVRVLVNPGDPDNGRVIDTGTTAELTTSGRTSCLYLIADDEATVRVDLHTVQDLRDEAAAAAGIPVGVVHGWTVQEIAASVAAYRLRLQAADAAGVPVRLVYGSTPAEIASSIGRLPDHSTHTPDTTAQEGTS